MRTLFTILVVLLIAAVSLSARAVDADEETTKNGAGPNYNLGSSEPAVDETVSAKPIILNAKNYNLTPDAFQKSALKALLK